MDKDRKTRPLAGPRDWKCPVHGCNVVHRTRFKTNEDTGRSKYAGEYFACPHYGDCGYYVSPGNGKTGAVVAVIEQTVTRTRAA
jgi:hypothetical protein